MVHITIPINPEPMSRPRVVKRGWRVMTFNPHKMMLFEHCARIYGMKQYRKPPIKNKPLSVTLLIYRKIPKSWSNKKKREADEQLIMPITKPDIDNYCKSIIDSQNKVIWYDDNLICHIDMKLFYSSKPHIDLYCNVIPTKEAIK